MRSRWRAGLLALMILALGCAALAEAAFDFSDLTLPELYVLRDRLDARIAELEKAEGARHFGPGSYLVGEDLPEGDYALVENPDALFPSVVVRADGADDGALVLHKLISGQADIRLTKGQWVSFTELEAWPLGTEPRRQQPDGTVPEGAYLVGTQLEPGCYRVELMDRAPLSDYDIYSGILCTDAHLIRIEVLHESVTLTLSEGEYIELSGCTLRPDAGDTEQENDQEG